MTSHKNRSPWTLLSQRRVRALALMLLVATAHGAVAFESGQPAEQWRIGPPHPTSLGSAGVPKPKAAALTGQVVHLGGTTVKAPHPLACDGAQYEYTLTPAEGLFQGTLAPPAERSARQLGVRVLPLLSLRVTCDGGVFDYHLLSPDQALLGLDGTVWRLQRRAAESSPEAALRDLLYVHLVHDMGFNRASVARKRSHLSPALARAIAAYFARPQPADTVPAINGDPFTDTQEYPTRFVIGRGVIDGESAQVPVNLGEAKQARVVHAVLRRVGGRWRVDDLRYDDGRSLRRLLQPQ
ncbi:MAG: DUF3828 domain-containing protein [Rhodoferax sp.]|nr:DUF3828 domain-containing protein [Rhodoferax sp.]